jgi:copper(I)-binding protein
MRYRREKEREVRRPTRMVLLSAATAAALALSGCGSSGGESSGNDESGGGSQGSEGGELQLADGWVKAADSGMTAAFGTLRNDSDEDIVLTGVSSEVADMGELHVTEKDGSGEMTMREAEDGFTIPAGGEHELEPGADHLMLMGLSEPVASGTTATVTVVADDGREWEFEVPAREFSGADESYDSGGSGEDTEGTEDMEMDSESTASPDGDG